VPVQFARGDDQAIEDKARVGVALQVGDDPIELPADAGALLGAALIGIAG
jgi:hypothetical protein